MRQIVERVQELKLSQLEECTFPHNMGERSIRWYCSQLLSEVSFHRWDLDRSLGNTRPLENALAEHLLPFMLDEHEGLFARRRATGADQSFIVGTPMDAYWTLVVTERGTTISAGRHGNNPLILAEPGWLALALFGRLRIDAASFSINGPADLPDTFAAVFGPDPNAAYRAGGR